MDLETAKKHLEAWLEADLKISQSESYSFNTPNGSQTISRTDATKVQAQINYWSNIIQKIQKPNAPKHSSAVF